MNLSELYIRKIIRKVLNETSIGNIDIPNTLWQRSIQWQENEIVVKNSSSSKIKILGIKKASELS